MATDLLGAIPREGTVLLAFGLALGVSGWTRLLNELGYTTWDVPEFALTIGFVVWFGWFFTWANRGGLPVMR